MMKFMKISRKMAFIQWKILLMIILLLFLDKSQCKLMNRTGIKSNVYKESENIDSGNANKTYNKSMCNNATEFEIKTINCLNIVTTEKWVLDVFQTHKEKSLFMEILKQLICSEYKNSLQCVHVIWTTCMNDQTTLIVQDYLSRSLALRYNQLCDINIHNDTGNYGNDTQVTIETQQDNRETIETRQQEVTIATQQHQQQETIATQQEKVTTATQHQQVTIETQQENIETIETQQQEVTTATQQEVTIATQVTIETQQENRETIETQQENRETQQLGQNRELQQQQNREIEQQQQNRETQQVTIETQQQFGETRQKHNTEAHEKVFSDFDKPIVHFKEKQTYSLETEMVIPEYIFEKGDDHQYDKDLESAILERLHFMENNGETQQSAPSNNNKVDISESLNFIQTKTKRKNKLLFKSTLKYQHY